MNNNSEESELTRLRRELAEREAQNEAIRKSASEAVETAALTELLKAQDREGIDNVRAVIAGTLGFVVVKKPHPATFRKFADIEKPTMEEFDALVRPCIVAPGVDEYDRLCRELPSFTLSCAIHVQQLSGTQVTKLVGK